jgi:hypothetical protein
MRPARIILILLFPTAIHAADPAIVLGHAFGSLGCINLEDPDGKTTCEARAISSGKGCYSLSSQTMRDKCLDESLYPVSSRSLSNKARKAEPVKPLPDSAKQFITPPALSEHEIERLEESFGLKNAKK